MKYSFQKALNFLYSAVDYEKSSPKGYNNDTYNLHKFRALLNSLDNSQDKIKTVLVAGTKGKGSTAAMIASILSEAGCKTGLYTSPHLIDVRERIRIGNRTISKQEFADLVFRIKEVMRGKDLSLYQTVFEILTASAFLYFAEKKVDIAIIEVGLGGRLDATNVCDPMISVITPISLDHCDILGGSILKIAKEKGGIIKKNGVTVVSRQPKDVLNLLKKISKARDSDFFDSCRKISLLNVRASADRTSFDLKTPDFYYKKLVIPLLGKHQVVNAATAMGVISRLRKFYKLEIPESAVRNGFSKVKWDGRLQVIGKNPWVVLDGAHNPASAKVLKNALLGIFTYNRLILLLGISANKNIRGIVRELVPAADICIVTRSDGIRGAEPEDIAQECRRFGKEIFVEETPEAAMKLARKIANKNDLICAAGSLYLVGAVLKSRKGVKK